MDKISNNGFTEPSGIMITGSDRLNAVFTDVSLIHQGAYFFIARGLRYGKWFALKGINIELREDEGLKTLLYKEFELLVGLNHPNIRKVLSLEEIEGWGECIVMEFTEGSNLHDWLQRPRNLPTRVRIACELADALDYIHKKGTVHRDIKPANIIITHIGESAKIIDFGLSDSDDYAIYKHPAGTPEYTSPEQASSGIPETSNDIYSLGVLLKTLLPEKRYRKLIKECTASAEKRPRSASYIKERISKLSERKKNLLLLFPILSVVTILFLYLAIDKSYKPNVHIPEAVEINNESDMSVSSLGVKQTSDVVNIGNIREPQKQSETEEISAHSKEEYAPDAQLPYSPEISIEIFLNEGKKSLDKAMGVLKDSKNKKGTPSEKLLDEEDYEIMKKVKESYINSLKFQIENSPSFGESYIFGKTELAEVDKGLDVELKKYFVEESTVKSR